jgi:hypothetical protein
MLAFSSKILYFVLALALELAGYGNDSFNIDIISHGTMIESFSVERKGQYSYFTDRNGVIRFEIEQSSSYAQVYTVFLPESSAAEAVNIEQFIRELRPFEAVPYQEISFEAEAPAETEETDGPEAGETKDSEPQEAGPSQKNAAQQNTGTSDEYKDEEDPLSGTTWLFAKSGEILIITVTGANVTLILH